jgi:hypothetical protein
VFQTPPAAAVAGRTDGSFSVLKVQSVSPVSASSAKISPPPGRVIVPA